MKENYISKGCGRTRNETSLTIIRKRFKPFHFIDQPRAFHQSQPTQSVNEPFDFLGKRPRQPIQCCVYGKYNLYRYYPHQKEKNKTTNDI